MQSATLTPPDKELTRRRRRNDVTDPMRDLDAYTDEELNQAVARVLQLARGEGLNDAEVQKFWQIYEEILRRRAPSVTAAQGTNR